MKTIIINLVEEIERKNKCIEELRNMNIYQYQFFEAINGSKLEYINLNERYQLVNDHENKKSYIYDKLKRMNGTGLRKGEIGCAISHLEIYKTLVCDYLNTHYIIFEDDFKCLVSNDKLNEYLKNLPDPNSYDVAMLSYSDYYPYEKLEEINSYYYKPRKRFFNRLTSYIITRRGSVKLLNCNYPHMGYPADDLISNMYLFSLDFEVIIPNETLFIHKNISSTIEKINNV